MEVYGIAFRYDVFYTLTEVILTRPRSGPIQISFLQEQSMTDLSETKKLTEYKPAHKVRFVTAASLFDGHDASINIMRRILMANGAEVIHLGHNRSVDEIVTAALQEDAQLRGFLRFCREWTAKV